MDSWHLNFSVYPDINEHFDIYKQEKCFQIVTVARHKGKQIALNSVKLTVPQMRYTAM